MLVVKRAVREKIFHTTCSHQSSHTFQKAFYNLGLITVMLIFRFACCIKINQVILLKLYFHPFVLFSYLHFLSLQHSLIVVDEGYYVEVGGIPFRIYCNGIIEGQIA